MTENTAAESEYDPFRVTLPIFDGPLDLLLHLVRKQQLDINELRLADLTEPYLEFIDQMKEMNLDQAAEFLSIASTLVWIKSKTLLPVQFHQEAEDPETVEELLVLRLQEYQKIKQAAEELRAMDMLGEAVFPRKAASEQPAPAPDQPVFEEVSLFALIEAFREVLERAKGPAALHVIPEQERVEQKLEKLLNTLTQKKSVYFHEMLAASGGRAEIVLAFMAMLELVRLKLVRIVQLEPQGKIYCKVTSTFAEADTDWIASVVSGMLGGATTAESLSQTDAAP